ncbi:MAG: isoprenylcysteine carboxylmethyltransferase family protein [Pseudomonadota bacterium]
MIALDLPQPILWALRWALFLGPLAAALLLARRVQQSRRHLVGGLFSFLYGLGTILALHLLAIEVGWWRYGGDVLMIHGVPADILIGGALLFGPVLYFALPNVAPALILLPIVLALHGTMFASLDPLVTAGPNWFMGVCLVFLVAHLPALYLARWTATDRELPIRAALLALGYGVVAFLLVPTLVMLAMGGTWEVGATPRWLLGLCLLVFGFSCMVGLAAVQTFVLHGEGTPIPLDATRRLVRTGLYAYVCNPMQLSTALAWIAMGVALANPWVASAALMAWVFVLGMVRWHHRQDLEQRFPAAWPRYRANVPEWLPRWRPWIPEPAQLGIDPTKASHRAFRDWLRSRQAIGIEIVEAQGWLSYREPGETQHFTGAAAAAKALNHLNLAAALLGAAVLLLVLPFQYARSRLTGPRPTEIRDDAT